MLAGNLANSLSRQREGQIGREVTLYIDQGRVTYLKDWLSP